MNNNSNPSEDTYYKRNRRNMSNASSGIYGLAFIGALVYYIQHASTFLMGVLGFFKAVLWPAVLIYRILDYLKM